MLHITAIILGIILSISSLSLLIASITFILIKDKLLPIFVTKEELKSSLSSIDLVSSSNLKDVTANIVSVDTKLKDYIKAKDSWEWFVSKGDCTGVREKCNEHTMYSDKEVNRLVVTIQNLENKFEALVSKFSEKFEKLTIQIAQLVIQK